MPQFKTQPKQIRHIFQCGQWELYRDNSTTSSSVLSIYEIPKTSYIDLDSRYTHDLSLIPNILGVIYATCTMGAVRIVKYKEDNYILIKETSYIWVW